MTLSFDPLDGYVQMIMNISDEKLLSFFDSIGIEMNTDEDEGILFDSEA
jgi:hypothetical protein